MPQFQAQPAGDLDMTVARCFGHGWWLRLIVSEILCSVLWLIAIGSQGVDLGHVSLKDTSNGVLQKAYLPIIYISYIVSFLLTPLRRRQGRMTRWGSTLRFRRSSRWPMASETRVTSRRLSISIVGDSISTHANSGRIQIVFGIDFDELPVLR